MPIDLKAKTAVVTGAGSGIGCAAAQAFARAGCNVVVADVVQAGGENTVKLLSNAGVKAVFVKIDVAAEPQIT